MAKRFRKKKRYKKTSTVISDALTFITDEMRTYLRSAAMVSEIWMDLRRLRSDPNVSDFLAATTRLIANLDEEFGVSLGHEFVDEMYLVIAQGEGLQEIVVDTLRKADLLNDVRTRHNITLSEASLDSGEIHVLSRNSLPTDIFVRRDKELEILKELSALFWSTQASNNIVVRRQAQYDEDEFKSQKVYFAEDVDGQGLYVVTDTAKKLSKRVADGGSVLIYGEPGSGKTETVRWLARHTDEFSIRFAVNDLTDLDAGMLIQIIKITRPQYIIIDDLDRSRDQAMLLDAIDTIRSEHEVAIMATANDLHRLDRALLRPGRFDTVQELGESADFVRDQMLLNASIVQEHREKMADWPIVYIKSFLTRMTYVTEIDAFNETLEHLNLIRGLDGKMPSGDLS